jgi:hypothetical protein
LAAASARVRIPASWVQVFMLANEFVRCPDAQSLLR